MSPTASARPKLTDAVLAKLACPAGKYEALVFDAAQSGFGVRVKADGKRVFIFQYRVGTTVRRHTIGVWGDSGLTAAKARKVAEGLRGQVHAGHDPVADRKAAQEAVASDAKAARARAAVETFTFGKLVDGWETKGLAHRRESYRTDATARLRSYFAAWRDRPAAEITKADAIMEVDRIEHERGVISARRGMAYARAAYGWANKRDMLDVNPFRGIAAPGKENPRDRVLTDDEVGAIWRAAVAIGGTPGAYVRVLLLTLQRRGEVAGMKWSELAADHSTWTIPADRAKNNKAHLVHLPPMVRDILADLPKMAGNPHVFPGRAAGPVAGFSYMMEELLRVMAGEPPGGRKRRRVGKAAPVGPAGWRFHDFRRSGVTALANMGIPPHVADKLLNHVTGSIQGVAAVYQRAEFLPERKRASETWAAHVLACADGQLAGNVVPLRAAG